MKLGCVLGTLLVFVSLAAVQTAQEQKPPIIDMHLHAMPADWFGSPGTTMCAGDGKKVFPGIDPRASVTPDQLESCPNPLVGAPTNEELLRESLASLEGYNVIRAVASGPLEQVRKWHTAAPKRIIPALIFSDPRQLDLKSLREHIVQGDIAILGEVLTQFTGLSPSGPELEPVLALAEELDIPVAIHMGLGAPGTAYEFSLFRTPKYRSRLSNPLLLEEALLRHPKLRVYVMHAGWPMLDEMIHLLYSHPQVYADVAWINWFLPRKEFHAYLRRLVEAGLAKRIMFGSDQMMWPETIALAIEAIETADFLSEEQKRDIFYNNAARFLRLDD